MDAIPEMRRRALGPTALLRRWRLPRAPRTLAAAAALAAALSLSACGGGGEVVIGPFSIDVLVGGSPWGGGVIVSGPTQATIDIFAGQSLELDANEPVVWTLYVNGTAISGQGVTVYYAGVYVTETTVSPSRIVIDTSAPQPLSSPVPITLVATSTIDAAQVATVDIWIH